eukprot:284039-Chlamydomonas_euryale.AAC.1
MRLALRFASTGVVHGASATPSVSRHADAWARYRRYRRYRGGGQRGGCSGRVQGKATGRGSGKGRFKKACTRGGASEKKSGCSKLRFSPIGV